MCIENTMKATIVFNIYKYTNSTTHNFCVVAPYDGKMGISKNYFKSGYSNCKKTGIQSCYLGLTQVYCIIINTTSTPTILK